MTSKITAAAAATLVAFAALAAAPAAAQTPRGPQVLLDGDLDRVAAGSAVGGGFAYADGLGEAHGQDAAEASSALATFVQSGPSAGAAAGAVTASASAGEGALASASSTLSLSVTTP